MGQHCSNSPWSHIVSRLSQAEGPGTHTLPASETSVKRQGLGKSWPKEARICILDRLSAQTVSVARSHPCSGYSGFQTWRRALAKRNEVCALSGERVIRGEAIYKLSRCLASSYRSNEVMLARHVDAILDEQEEAHLHYGTGHRGPTSARASQVPISSQEESATCLR